MKSRYAGFTLVELLVVVAIIAILLSLLMPALRKTRYQAKLVVCSSQLHQNGLALLSYANVNKSRWPERWASTGGAGTAVPNQLTQIGTEINDLRPLLSRYTKINGTFRDPFVDKLDFMQTLPSPAEIYASYHMWFGWPPRGPGGNLDYTAPGWEGQMTTVNDSMYYQGHRINVLMSDFMGDNRPTWPQVGSSHPDYPKGAIGPITFNGPTPLRNQVSSFFIAQDGDRMNRMDLNYLFNDGHTKTITQIRSVLGNFDARMIRVGYHWDAQHAWLPPTE